MLVLSKFAGQKLHVKDITITAVATNGDEVKIVLDKPKDIIFFRKNQKEFSKSTKKPKADHDGTEPIKRKDLPGTFKRVNQ